MAAREHRTRLVCLDGLVYALFKSRVDRPYTSNDSRALLFDEIDHERHSGVEDRDGCVSDYKIVRRLL